MHLPPTARVSAEWRRALVGVVERTAEHPVELPAIIRDELGVDVSARYAGIGIPHPFGKASGQLSFTRSQVSADIDAGLAFIVLKTVIAEAADGTRSMGAWAVPETRMRVERRRAKRGIDGWTVTWTGRGWAGGLEDYVALFTDAMQLAKARDVPVIPSVKYHLPEEGEAPRREEYLHTTTRLLSAWDEVGCGGPMLLEKDFSPTLAGDRRAASRERVLDWIAGVPSWIRAAAHDRVSVGIKLMNAMFDDAFQVEMIRTAAATKPAVLVAFNRLFDAVTGVAYGGYDLSDRNLRVLDLVRDAGIACPPLSATGNICSGRLMVEYAQRGCENGQVHTFFQVPTAEYIATGGNHAARALHTLLLHPEHGLVVWLRHLAEAEAIPFHDGVIRFLDVVGTAGAS